MYRDEYVEAVYSDINIFTKTKPVFRHDYGISMRVSGLPTTSVVFEYTNQDMTTATRVLPYVQSADTVVASIPDEFFLYNRDIQCYIVWQDATSRAVIQQVTVPMIQRKDHVLDNTLVMTDSTVDFYINIDDGCLYAVKT